MKQRNSVVQWLSWKKMVSLIVCKEYETDSIPNNGHAIRTSSGAQGYIDDNQKVESIRNEFTHDGLI